MDAASSDAVPCPNAEPLAPPHWPGPPIGQFRLPAAGVAQLGPMQEDTLMLWTGGASDVAMHCAERRYAWRRTSGMVDLLPAGSIVTEVQWQGDPMQCTWVHLEGSLSQGRPSGAGAPPHMSVRDPHITDLVQRLAAQAQQRLPLGAAYAKALAGTLCAYLQSR